MNQGGNAGSAEKDEEKTTNALLDARLKVIEARLKIANVPCKVKTEVQEVDGIEVIEILSDNDDDDESFHPQTSSTKIKEEHDTEE